VGQSALGAALVGAVPIPVSDVLPITALQIAMLLRIARVFGFTISRERAQELLPVLAAGILLREGGHRLRERFPRQKALIAVSVGGLWTYLVGRASVEYFDRLSQVLRQPPAEGYYQADSM
jgi:GTP-binding protein Era